MTVFKLNWGDTIYDRIIFGDKIYSDFEYFVETKKLNQNIEMRTLVKEIKRQADEEKNEIRLTMICFLGMFQ